MISFRRLAVSLFSCVCLAAALAQAGDDPPFREPNRPIEDPAFHPEEGIRPAQKVPFPAIVDWRTLRITLSRSGCYGTCPIYSVEILGDGTVNYFGQRFVKAMGGRTAQIDEKAVRDLYGAFAKAEFFWTNDEYEGPITDFPTFVVTIAFDGHKKIVRDYAGARYGLPRVVADLEGAIDAAAGTSKWVHGD